jgi:hypothetical protein
VTGSIATPFAPAEILRQLPGVERVERLVTTDRPARRIVHIADWHHATIFRLLAKSKLVAD